MEDKQANTESRRSGLFIVLNGQSANDVWYLARDKFIFSSHVRKEISRGGDVREILHVGFQIEDPRQRWVYYRKPAMNLAFAIAEVIWILRGRRDSAFLNYWNRKLPEFAGTGEDYYGAYGYRLRKNFGIDQLTCAYNALLGNATSRQIVLQIWDPKKDLPKENGKPRDMDIPCNIVCMLKIRDGKLIWTEIMRSNDLFLGVPHNIVQFTSLQEVLAGWLGVDVGPYSHFSDSLHVYDRDFRFVESTQLGDLIVNDDNLSVEKELASVLWGELERRVIFFINEELTKEEHVQLAEWDDAPQSFRNLLLVLAGEAARRRRWEDLAGEIMAGCTNPVFIYMWEKWMGRVGERT